MSLPQRLQELRGVRVAACGRGGFRLTGEGDVVARTDPDGSILISESGAWRGADGRGWRFTNAWRWRFDGDQVRLSQERRGPGQAVELVVLVVRAPDRWEAATPHLCGADLYSAKVRLTDDGLVLRWRITGPRKTQLLRAAYRGKP